MKRLPWIVAATNSTEIDGVAKTEYHIDDIAGFTDSVDETISELSYTMWVGDDELIRRVVTDDGAVTTEMNYLNYRVNVDLEAPPADEVNLSEFDGRPAAGPASRSDRLKARLPIVRIGLVPSRFITPTASTASPLISWVLGHESGGCSVEENTSEVPMPDNQPVVFSPFGLGVLDLALGAYVHQQARAMGKALAVPDFFAETRRWLASSACSGAVYQNGAGDPGNRSGGRR